MLWKTHKPWLVACFFLIWIGVVVCNAWQPENQANAYVNQNVPLPRSLFSEAEVLDMRTLHPAAVQPPVIDAGESVHVFTDAPTITAGEIAYTKVKVLTGPDRGKIGYMATALITPMR